VLEANEWEGCISPSVNSLAGMYNEEFPPTSGALTLVDQNLENIE
jgi:hypothetical protein